VPQPEHVKLNAHNDLATARGDAQCRKRDAAFVSEHRREVGRYVRRADVAEER
jgi:hypothetical protein